MHVLLQMHIQPAQVVYKLYNVQNGSQILCGQCYLADASCEIPADKTLILSGAHSLDWIEAGIHLDSI